VIERVIEVDGNRDLYRQYLAEPYYHGNRIPDNLLHENVLRRLKSIIRNKDRITPVARQKLKVTRKEMSDSMFGHDHTMKKVERRLKGMYYRYRYCT
jgi:hypothetical protein